MPYTGRLHRHPLPLDLAVGESAVRLAESLRESTLGLSWERACDRAFSIRDALMESVGACRAGEGYALVPGALDAISRTIPMDPALKS